MSYRQYISDLFNIQVPNGDRPTLTCSQVTDIVSIYYQNYSKYLNGSISSILRSMVKRGELEVDPSLKGPRGGKVYRIKI